MEKIVLIIIVLLISTYIYGYEPEEILPYNWKHYTNTSHIHQLECIHDSLLCATWGGLNVYDKNNNRFSIYTKGDGLTRNELLSVDYIESIDEYWFGTYLYGISRMKNGEFIKPYQENQGVDANYIHDICSNEEYIFVGTENGLILFEIILGSDPIFKKRFSAPNWLSHDKVNGIVLDDSNRVWIATESGIDYTNISYDEMILPENWEHVNFSTSGYPLTSVSIKNIDYYNGKIYFGTTYGFAIIKNIYSDSFTFKGFNQQLPLRIISAIEAENDTTVWVAFGEWDEDDQVFSDAKGIRKYYKEGLVWDWISWDEDGSLYNQIADIQIDDYGSVWVASWGNGIYKLVDTTWVNYKRNCIGFNFVSYLLFDNSRRLWCASGLIGSGSRQGVRGISVRNDGVWKTYNEENSKLVGDKSLKIDEDTYNRIWITDWNDGITRITNYGDTTELWQTITAGLCDVPGILDENTTSFVKCDEDGNIWVGDYNTGISIVIENDPYTIEDDSVYKFEPFFETPHPDGKQDPLSVNFGFDKVSLAGYYSRLLFWSGQGFPPSQAFTVTANYPTMNGPFMNIELEDSDLGRFIWTGGVDGLYMYDLYWDDWYKYTNGLVQNVKTYYWDGSEWINWFYYWQNEQGEMESVMGDGKTSDVNFVFIDPHGRKWIATNGGGISILGKNNIYFSNLTTDNSELPSNVVLSFAYDKYSGELYVGTTEGMCSLNIGASVNDGSYNESVSTLLAFPNPFKPADNDYIYFQPSHSGKLPQGKNELYIYNLAGELIIKLNESDHFRFFWDGNNESGKEVATGIYFFVLASEYNGDYLTGKFAIIR